MDAAGALDLDGLRAHVGFQLEHQVSALVVGGSIGEASSLSVEERRDRSDGIRRLDEDFSAYFRKRHGLPPRGASAETAAQVPDETSITA
jgi:hypothetical protein